MRFSQRVGINPEKPPFQREEVSIELRSGIWDGFQEIFFSQYRISHVYRTILNSNLEDTFKHIWHSYFKQPIDTIPHMFANAVAALRKYFFECSWFEALDFTEVMAEAGFDRSKNDFTSFCNRIFERENSAYRFVNDKIAEITSKEEIESIEEAIQKSDALVGVTTHLKSALQLLSDRKKPNFRNSIKESISAVEAISILISEDPKATLGSALKKIEEKAVIHKALKNSFSSLYGYTSDSDGIRHDMLEESTLTYSDAKYMLVACSAFINYLLCKCSDLKIIVKNL